MKKRIGILAMLIVFCGLGMWLGKATRPENFQLSGTLSFDPAQVPSADYELGDFILQLKSQGLLP